MPSVRQVAYHSGLEWCVHLVVVQLKLAHTIQVPMNLRLSHNLVTRVFGIILGPVENVRARPYPWQITKSLLDRGVVSDSMVKGGFIAALYARGDWVCAFSLGFEHRWLTFNHRCILCLL